VHDKLYCIVLFQSSMTLFVFMSKLMAFWLKHYINRIYIKPPGMQASIWCLSQARINWEGCIRKGILRKNGGDGRGGGTN